MGDNGCQLGKMDMDAHQNGGAFGHRGAVERHPLPLPMGEVAERSEAGEGSKALSVTFGDSSPGGRAKGGLYPSYSLLARKMERICTDTLHLLFYVHPQKALTVFSRSGLSFCPVVGKTVSDWRIFAK